MLSSVPKSINKLYKGLVPVKGIGSWIIDINTHKYLDLTSGIGALSLGHNHPHVVTKVKQQLDSYIHMGQQIFDHHPILSECNTKLLDIMPSKYLDSIHYLNSGSEAVDNAIKIARKHTGKTNIIAMNKGFHGRTIGALSLGSSSISYKQGSQPLLPGIYFSPHKTKEAIDLILRHQSSPDDTAAIIIEPVQGEGGIYSLSNEFVSYLREICDTYNIMLIADEIQCGVGRTGTWWNIEQKGVDIDMLIFGKGVAGGFQLTGIASKSYIMDYLGVNYLGGTYGGNALSLAAACATLDVIKDEKLLENSTKQGDKLYKQLKDLKYIKTVRQYGLMIAIEFDSVIKMSHIITMLRHRGILVLLCGSESKYMRLLPPLNISDLEIEYFIQHLTDVMESY